VGGAAVRSFAGELTTAPLRFLPLSLLSKAAPVARAAEEVEPILAGTAKTATGKAAEALRPGYALPEWWQGMRTQPPKVIAETWDKLGSEGQAQLAGENLGAMQTVIDTIRAGAEPCGNIL